MSLTRRQFDVLEALTFGSLTQRELESRTHYSSNIVNKVMKELSELNFVENSAITISGREALEQYRVKRAIFLAAGFGSRMVPLTYNTPKPLVRVHGTRIIDTLLDAVVAAGIEEIYIVRGYLGEQFDQLLYKYPMVKFIENPFYNESNNISSAMCVRYLFQNAYVLEADLVLSNPKIIRKYEYSSNFLGIPVEKTDDWCVYTDSYGVITEISVGGTNCHQMSGISYWDAKDGAKLANDIEEVYRTPGGKDKYWDQVPFVHKKNNYKVYVRECKHTDIVEIDTYKELKKIDKLYEDA